MRSVGHLKKGAKSLFAGVNLTLVIVIPKIDGERKAGLVDQEVPPQPWRVEAGLESLAVLR